jgi:hypothetical protein
MLLLTAISLIQCPSIPFISIFFVFLPHSEPTTLEYVDVVASAQLTILKVSYYDGTIILYSNASAV